MALPGLKRQEPIVINCANADLLIGSSRRIRISKLWFYQPGKPINSSNSSSRRIRIETVKPQIRHVHVDVLPNKLFQKDKD